MPLVAISGLLLCCSGGGPSVQDAGTTEAGFVEAGVVDAGVADSSAPDANAAVPEACDLTCSQLSLTVTANGKKFAFERAQFGFNGSERALYIEAHRGGDPACPTKDSPSPDTTLIISGIVVPSGIRELGDADGVKVSLLDFKGDFVTTPNPIVKATAVKATVRAFRAARAEALVAFDLEATFPGGITVSGKARAAYCASLD